MQVRPGQSRMRDEVITPVQGGVRGQQGWGLLLGLITLGLLCMRKLSYYPLRPAPGARRRATTPRHSCEHRGAGLDARALHPGRR